MLAVVAGLKSTNIFEIISRKMIGKFHTRRGVIYALVFGTFFFDMIVANDMSLITFLPLTYIVLHSTKNDQYLAFTFIMQTIAANMGGMITPYGNPQNLYLYSYYNIQTSEFLSILLVQSITVAILLYICCAFVKEEKLLLKDKSKIIVNKNKLYIYAILFVLVLLAGIVSCQFISNVPTAIFLSKFTTNYKELLISVNIGSLGILTSSLASLITLKEFLKHQPKKFKKYLGMFTIFNTIFLTALLIVTKVV